MGNLDWRRVRGGRFIWMSNVTDSADRLSRLVAVQLRIVQSQSSFDELLNEIACEAQALTGAESAAVELVDGDELVYRAASGTLSNSVGARLFVSGSLSGIAMSSNQVLCADDTESDPRVDLAACRRLNIRSMVISPLFQGGSAAGVLKVASSKPGAFADADLGVLRILGELIAGALNRQLAAEAGAKLLAERTTTLARLESAQAEAEAARIRAEKADQAKSDFLANMSHELRTPLTAIIGFAGLLEGTGDLGAKERRFAEKIRSAGGNLLALVNDLLDHSKLQAGQVELAAQPLALAGFLADVLDFLSVQANAKGIGLSLDAAEDLPAEMMIDGARLRQVLLNLLSNAVKFTAEGQVTLAVASTPDGSRVRFTVTDTGAGIAPDHLPRLFDRFTQADADTSRTYGGTGLGLAISKALVELLGGKLSVASRLGQGSSFTFEVPQRARASRPALKVVG